MTTIGTKQRYVRGIVAMNDTSDMITLATTDPTAAPVEAGSPPVWFPGMGNDDTVEVDRPHNLHSGSVVTVTYAVE